MFRAGQGFVFISHLGTVHPSGVLPVAAGGVRTGRLAGIYRTSPLFTGLRDHGRLTGRCGACEFAPVCGGSRSGAFALTGDPYAEDPWCSYQPGTFPHPDDLAAMGRGQPPDHDNERADMQTGSLAAALEREHHEIDAGIAAFTAAPWDRQPLARAIGALRRHIYLEEEFLFPLLREAEPGLAAPVFVMLREHAQIWGTLDALERDLDAGTGAGLALGKRVAVQLLHHNLKEEKILYPRADEALPAAAAGCARSSAPGCCPRDGCAC